MINTKSFLIRLGLATLLLFIAFSSTNTAWARQDRVFRLVIDPGHGGHNDGTKYNNFKEKDLTLTLAMKVGSMIKQRHPEVRVLYTRSRDIFKTLEYRPYFAGRVGADLFISIHINHEPSRSVSGTETFILPHSKEHINLQYIKGPSKRRTQLMNRSLSAEIAGLLEQEYRKLGQHSRGVKEKSLQVLRENSVPAVLTEVGFLSNSRDRRLLCSRSGQGKIARAIANAFSKYYQNHHKAGAKSVSRTEIQEDPDQTKEYNPKVEKRQTRKNEKGWYRVQFMATAKHFGTKDRKFRRFGVSIHRIKNGKLYHYMAGNYRTLQSAKKLRSKVRRYYKDCFIVKVNEQGERLEAIY